MTISNRGFATISKPSFLTFGRKRANRKENSQCTVPRFESCMRMRIVAYHAPAIAILMFVVERIKTQIYRDFWFSTKKKTCCPCK